MKVYVMEFGHWNYRGLSKKPQGVKEDFWKHFEHLLRRITRDAEVNNGQGVAYILDWDGFSLGNYASPKGTTIKGFTFLLPM